jgi:hypothetical protein
MPPGALRVAIARIFVTKPVVARAVRLELRVRADARVRELVGRDRDRERVERVARRGAVRVVHAAAEVGAGRGVQERLAEGRERRREAGVAAVERAAVDEHARRDAAVELAERRRRGEAREARRQGEGEGRAPGGRQLRGGRVEDPADEAVGRVARDEGLRLVRLDVDRRRDAERVARRDDVEEVERAHRVGEAAHGVLLARPSGTSRPRRPAPG